MKNHPCCRRLMGPAAACFLFILYSGIFLCAEHVAAQGLNAGTYLNVQEKIDRLKAESGASTSSASSRSLTAEEKALQKEVFGLIGKFKVELSTQAAVKNRFLPIASTRKSRKKIARSMSTAAASSNSRGLLMCADLSTAGGTGGEGAMYEVPDWILNYAYRKMDSVFAEMTGRYRVSQALYGQACSADAFIRTLYAWKSAGIEGVDLLIFAHGSKDGVMVGDAEPLAYQTISSTLDSLGEPALRSVTMPVTYVRTKLVEWGAVFSGQCFANYQKKTPLLDTTDPAMVYASLGFTSVYAAKDVNWMPWSNLFAAYRYIAKGMNRDYAVKASYLVQKDIYETSLCGDSCGWPLGEGEACLTWKLLGEYLGRRTYEDMLGCVGRWYVKQKADPCLYTSSGTVCSDPIAVAIQQSNPVTRGFSTSTPGLVIYTKVAPANGAYLRRGDLLIKATFRSSLGFESIWPVDLPSGVEILRIHKARSRYQYAIVKRKRVTGSIELKFAILNSQNQIEIKKIHVG